MAIKIIGIGPGSPDYILPMAIKEMEATDTIIGFKRAIESVEYIRAPKVVVESLKELLQYIQDNPNKTLGVIASGDPCFYGILDYLKKNIKQMRNLAVVPGISSFQYLMSQLQKSWQSAYVGSLHGREADFDKIVREYTTSVWLTDKVQNPAYICKRLLEMKGNYIVYVGENLSYEDEKISQGNPAELHNQSWCDLSVVVVEHKL
ncbi:MAG TPA: precorrin-6y C5,15-methyltransferase (decarboxylating) subunit CbiE [Epulopiscium sp.]|nr:precorrin-6y C5,15-methyltransferase (decarboxylating) subunit CbiE [Candidatus Epulonipiscium sp.]